MNRREVIRAVLGAGAAWGLRARAAPGRAAPEMLERHVPSSGEFIPVIGLGTWQTFDVGEGAAERAPLRDVMDRFWFLGGRVIDVSPMYGRAEQVVGELMHDLDLRRAMFVATKVWTSGRPEGIRQMERSLRLLGVERIDLMQVHNLIDAETHLRTFQEWKAAGRLRYTGVTHYEPGAFARVERVIRNHRPDFVQINYSIGDREAEERILPAAAEYGVAVLVNRPFGGGELFARVEGQPLPDWAWEIGCTTWGQFFLKYILGHPAVTSIIPATSKLSHLEENMAVGRLPLPDPITRRRMVEAFEAL